MVMINLLVKQVLVLKMGKTWAYLFTLSLVVNWYTQVEGILILPVLVPLKGFEEKITQGGILGIIVVSQDEFSCQKDGQIKLIYVGLHQFLHRIHLLSFKLNVAFPLYHPL